VGVGGVAERQDGDIQLDCIRIMEAVVLQQP